ncbi:MAG: chromosomal replication initiator protein DnaA [Bacteroidota bacterium]
MSDHKLDALSLFVSDSHIVDTNELKIQYELHREDKNAIIHWSKCLDIIRDNVSKQVFKTWFEPLKALKWEEEQLTVLVPSQFYCEWLDEHFYSLLEKTLGQVLVAEAKLNYLVLVDENQDSLERRTIRLPALQHAPVPEKPESNVVSGKQVKEFTTYLNPRYSFDNFIKGESNQLAWSAGMAISQNPGGTRFNPLVIYGGTGLGKTHLVQGIGNSIIRRNSNARVLYTTSERFTNEFIAYVQNNKMSEFVNYYRNIDVLIVDDIQFFSGKEKTQDNFFHTFNALHQAGKQLILTSDRPPRDLTEIDDRLISRFQWGLIVDIQPPDFEMRMAILQRKSLDEGIELPTDVVEYIARHVTNSIREMEGVLISLIAKYSLDSRELNLELAKEVVHGAGKAEPRQITIEDIKAFVSDYYKIPVETIESKSRKHEIALARQMCIYLSKQLTQNSLKSIGAHFGGRDHSTVLHSIQTIEDYRDTDKNVRNASEYLYKTLKNRV